MVKVATIGEILVEVMADTVGDGFTAPVPLTGPYPSGAPAIFISQAARMGQPAAMASAVGRDDFGRCNLDRLIADGVDCAAILVSADRPTGSAFVRYRADGSRDFVYNIAHSAMADFRRTDAVSAMIAATGHLHLVGTSLAAAPVRAVALQAAAEVKARGGTVSFDPNLRKETLALPGVAEAALAVLAAADLFLPSGGELFLGTEVTDPGAAIAFHLAAGRRAVVWKQGAAGAVWADAGRRLAHGAFPVTEVDPTGAGDCFAGAFVPLWLRGTDPAEALRLACAAGALAVTARGPMEGARTEAEVRAFADATPAGLPPAVPG